MEKLIVRPFDGPLPAWLVPAGLLTFASSMLGGAFAFRISAASPHAFSASISGTRTRPLLFLE